MPKAGSFLIAIALVGCGVGDPSTDPGPDPNPNGLRCTAGFTTTGTFTPGTPSRPLDDTGTEVGGCWPVGTWTFTATLDGAGEAIDIDGDGDGDRCGDVSGTAAPTVDANYSFRVDRTENPEMDGLVESYTYLGTSSAFFHVKVSEGGGGDCEGIMEFVSADKKQHWTFNSTICTSSSCSPASNTIAGKGDYTEYPEPRAPWRRRPQSGS